MKKIITALLSIAALNSVTVTADTLDDVADRGTLRCGVVLDFPPIGYRDANNEPAGLTWITVTILLSRWKWM